MAHSLELDNFTYEQRAQRIIFGWGRLADIEDEADHLSARRIFMISERSTKPVADEIRQRLGDRIAGKIPEVRPHVPKEDVDAVGKQADAAGSDLVLTVGGGSATGLGKAIVLERAVPLMTVATTYAGSEVTPIYGITEAGRKRTGSDERVLPKTVIYDAQLTIPLSKRVTATSGMNAIAHCVEGLYAPNASPITTLLAEEGIRVLNEALPACLESPSDKAFRSGALYGAYLAGTVLAGTGMAIHHRICHVLGGTFGLAHGDVNAVVLPHAVAFNQPFVPEPIARIAQIIGTQTAASGLFELAQTLEAPTSLAELGMGTSDLERAASLVVDGDFYNPRPVAIDDVVQILEAAYDGRRPDDTRPEANPA